MSVKIRLRRMGRKKQPHYRVVVADTTAPRDGRFVESIGYYRPLTEPARLVLDMERVDYWLGQGALPSPTVKTLVSKARKGGDASLALGEVDVEAQKAKRAEELTARRQAEQEALKAAEAEKKAEAEAKKAEAEAEKAAAEKAEAEAKKKAEAEAAEDAGEAEEEAPEAASDDEGEEETREEG
ncbi:MAG: 30S ribosomal protein S16 [Gemmatimonadales bacterium]|nr:MAG: 30S ribosomal protein S16 [Gemmatimonadales bacterium]